MPVLAVFTPTVTSAAATDSDLQNCAQIEQADERLSCYDGLVSRPVQPITLSEQAASDQPTSPATPSSEPVQTATVSNTADEVAGPSSALARAWDLDREVPAKVFILTCLSGQLPFAGLV